MPLSRKLNVQILTKLGKINGFSRLPMAPLTSCHSDSAQEETIESNILTHVPTFYVALFRRYAS